MNNQVLRKNKIDTKYVLSKNKFLYTFGYLCIDEDIIRNDNFNKKELYYLLEQKLTAVSQDDVTYENVARGDVILVGRPNSFKAFLRPMLQVDVKKPVTRLEKTLKRKFSDENPISELSLTELLNGYRTNIDNELGQDYFEELVSRISNVRCTDIQNRKNFVKVYKRNHVTLDKKI